jgi:hypothetical protein
MVSYKVWDYVIFSRSIGSRVATNPDFRDEVVAMHSSSALDFLTTKNKKNSVLRHQRRRPTLDRAGVGGKRHEGFFGRKLSASAPATVMIVGIVTLLGGADAVNFFAIGRR